jgi:hypothetical protein
MEEETPWAGRGASDNEGLYDSGDFGGCGDGNSRLSFAFILFCLQVAAWLRSRVD